MNKVTGKYTAIVDGQPTGLAGCKGCPLNCLRKDNRLEVVLSTRSDCPLFIPIK